MLDLRELSLNLSSNRFKGHFQIFTGILPQPPTVADPDSPAHTPPHLIHSSHFPLPSFAPFLFCDQFFHVGSTFPLTRSLLHQLRTMWFSSLLLLFSVKTIADSLCVCVVSCSFSPCLFLNASLALLSLFSPSPIFYFFSSVVSLNSLPLRPVLFFLNPFSVLLPFYLHHPPSSLISSCGHIHCDH